MLDGNVNETPKDERDICLENDSYRVALPMNVSWPQGMAICGKLGSGRMTEVKDVQDLEYTVNRFKNLKSLCQKVWTPITDEKEEGFYRSAITEEFPSFLPWDILQPNGLKEQNYAAIEVSSLKYIDWSIIFDQSCVACDLNITTRFFLTGLCEDTFLDSVYFLNNNHNDLEYQGMHTIIR